ncbi:MAG: hypothetical protein WCE90_12460 [Candidatus Zixiibacteriota bacterium]
MESRIKPRGERRQSDEEEEKEFYKTIERFRTSWPDISEDWLNFYVRLFEIEKEQAKKEKRHIDDWWNVLSLLPDDPDGFEHAKALRRRYGVPPLTEEHRDRVKKLMIEVGHPLVDYLDSF